jgi:HPt (histidine-containing phosphotransfer) domain-containing protein
METCGGDPEFVGVLLETFAEEAPAALSELRSGLESGDRDAVRRAAHTLKSNAATFGATELAELCAHLETRAAADLADGETRLERIEAAYVVTESQLAAVRDELA